MRRGFALVERLRHDPESRWRADSLGGSDHIGWTAPAYLLAAVVDAINTNTKATAQRKASLKKKERTTRPQARQRTDYRPTSVRDTNFGVLFGEEQ